MAEKSKSKWWAPCLVWAGIITFVILALEGIIPESFLDKVFQAIGILLKDTFGEFGSWKSYIAIACMWLVAVGTLLGLGWMVIEWIIKFCVFVKKMFRRKK